jgi:hypothetical protein
VIPVEYVSVLLVFVFGFVGMARKFPQELGATVAYTAMLFAIALGGERLGSFAYALLYRGNPEAAPDLALVQWVVIMGFIGAWVVMVYAGQTFSFSGKWPPNPITGLVFDLLIGLFNGWIVVWTAWQYTHRLGYPHQALGWFVPPLSSRAGSWVELAPLALIPDGREPWVLGGFLAFLIFLRVLK